MCSDRYKRFLDMIYSLREDLKYIKFHYDIPLDIQYKIDNILNGITYISPYILKHNDFFIIDKMFEVDKC